MEKRYVQLRRNGITISEFSPQRIQFLTQNGYVLVEDAPGAAAAPSADDEKPSSKKDKSS